MAEHDDDVEEGRSYADIFSQAEIEFDIDEDEYIADMLVIYRTTTINPDSAEDGMERTRVAMTDASSWVMGLGLAEIGKALIQEHGMDH